MYEEAETPEISVLVELEFFAAVSLRVRIGDLAGEEAARVSALFDAHLRDGLYGRRSPDAGHYRLAPDYVARFDLPLKAPDALHLAVCASEDLTLFTADRQLARNAESLGVRTELVGRT